MSDISFPQFSSSAQRSVAEFHAAMGQPVNATPRVLPAERVGLRMQLIQEEVDELQEALEGADLVETADACIDILYVVYGLMVEAGIDAKPLFQEVHASNMSKFGADGKPLISRGLELDGVYAGRVMKGPNYFRPNLLDILQSQAQRTADDMLEGL